MPKDRSLSPSEIRVMLKQLEHVATLPTIRLGMRLYLLTIVRKSELQDAVWDEVDFENAVWTVPKERMKRSKAHNVWPEKQGKCRPSSPMTQDAIKPSGSVPRWMGGSNAAKRCRVNFDTLRHRQGVASFKERNFRIPCATRTLKNA